MVVGKQTVYISWLLICHLPASFLDVFVIFALFGKNLLQPTKPQLSQMNTKFKLQVNKQENKTKSLKIRNKMSQSWKVLKLIVDIK